MNEPSWHGRASLEFPVAATRMTTKDTSSCPRGIRNDLDEPLLSCHSVKKTQPFSGRLISSRVAQSLTSMHILSSRKETMASIQLQTPSRSFRRRRGIAHPISVASFLVGVLLSTMFQSTQLVAANPTTVPSTAPSEIPSPLPSDGSPSVVPSDQPSTIPSDMPSDVPSDMPSLTPTESLEPVIPSSVPTLTPSGTAFPTPSPNAFTNFPTAGATSNSPSAPPSPEDCAPYQIEYVASVFMFCFVLSSLESLY